MRTGVSYMGHHNPKHLATDLRDMAELGCGDVLLAAQENDFVHMTGKIEFLPRIARDLGIRPLAIFWGVLNLFGGGRSSQYLLEHPDGHQVKKDGSWHSAGCYNNPGCVRHIKEMIARVGELGFEGYFIDEPSPLDCYCESCRELYTDWYGGELHVAGEGSLREFRARCCLSYIREISAYIKTAWPAMETMCCVMPVDQSLWAETAAIDALDNLGTDIYWVNDDRNVEEAAPMIRDLDAVCKQHGKIHHEWLQCWIVKGGREERIRAQGEIIIREQPDALYVWAYGAQVGTTETCDDPDAAWARARDVLRMAKEG